MKKFLLFMLLAVSTAVLGQELPSGNNFTEIINNYKAELGTGNFVYSVPLFDIKTANPDFNFSGSLHYNAQAASSVYTTEGMLSRGWSVDFLPSVYRNVTNSLWDEVYYKPNSAEITDDGDPYTRILDSNDLFEFSAFGLRGSFRLKYNVNNTVDVHLVDSNTFVDITVICTMEDGVGDGKIIDLLSFTIKDKDGFSYIFNSVQEQPVILTYKPGSVTESIADLALPDPDGYNLCKQAFLLGSVTDKHNRPLIQFIYKTFPWSASSSDKSMNYNQKVIDKVVLPRYGKPCF